MPELPEVETIVRRLRPEVKGRKILGFWANTTRLFRAAGLGREAIKKRVLGKKILGVERAGKNIVLKLASGPFDNAQDKQELWIHLMMTGKLLILQGNVKAKNVRRSASNKHIRFLLKLSGEKGLALHDIRKFGLVRLLGNPIAKLGRDALKITERELAEILRKRKTKIKPLLLGQKLISGIGNIYADEILWEAGIHPQREAGSLSDKEASGLNKAIKKVLRLAIKKEGTTFSDYLKPDGSEGGYYKIRKAYDRAGEKCKKDGVLIQRITIAQRGTCFCPKHQK